MKKIYKVSINKFLDWYISDHKDAERIGFAVYENLLNYGEVEFTIQSLWDERGYTPASIIINWDGDEYDELDEALTQEQWDNCEFIFVKENE